MAFYSILYRDAADQPAEERPDAPRFFVDLNLDQIVSGITAGKEEYDLVPFFRALLHDLDAVAYRHEVMRDVDRPEANRCLAAFARHMRDVRDHLTQARKLRHPLQKQAWYLDAGQVYCNAVEALLRDLSSMEPGARGFIDFRSYLATYAASPAFETFHAAVRDLKERLAAISYCTLIQGTRVDVRLYEGEPDYSAEIAARFERFQQGKAEGYSFDFGEPADVNHIEGQILDRVALLYPAVFGELRDFCGDLGDFQDGVLAVFDREIQFYLAYLAYIDRLRDAGLDFCYPQMTERRGEIFDYGTFDLALASRLAEQNAKPICNDFHLRGPERIIVVSGPNQGGKTTFARTFGQLHYLAGLGCPIPGSRAQLTLVDQLFTHFERRESMNDLRGKLQDDLVRIRAILDSATPQSVVVMNEIFSSTALQDAIVLGHKIAADMIDLDLYCVWVTFIDELASLGTTTVSMTSTVVPDRPAERTYKIVRRPADGLAYAMAIAEKYGLTHQRIKERVAP